MRYAILFFALFIIQPVFANGGSSPPGASASAGASAGAKAGAAADAVANSSNANNVNVNNSLQAGDGHATATGGRSTSSLAYSHEEVRQAPSVGIVPGNNTAPYLKCIGVGGSDEKGSAVLGHCWLQRDVYALVRSEKLAGMGLPGPAARAYCSQRMHWRDFGSKSGCINQLTEQLQAAQTKEVMVFTVPDQQCNEKLSRCENTVLGK